MWVRLACHTLRMVQAVGFMAGVLTAFAFLPQVIQTLRTRSAADLSAAMLGAQSAGVALWIVYGVAIGAPPVILANAFTLILSLILLGFKLAYSPQALTGRKAPRE